MNPKAKGGLPVTLEGKKEECLFCASEVMPCSVQSDSMFSFLSYLEFLGILSHNLIVSLAGFGAVCVLVKIFNVFLPQGPYSE